jgi:syndecan 4
VITLFLLEGKKITAWNTNMIFDPFTNVSPDLDAPTNLLTREVTEDTADVSWDRPLGDIDGYMISYSSAEGSSGEIPVGADSSSYRLTGLTPGVIYTVYIWAVKGSRVSRKSSTVAETGH